MLRNVKGSENARVVAAVKQVPEVETLMKATPVQIDEYVDGLTTVAKVREALRVSLKIQAILIRRLL